MRELRLAGLSIAGFKSFKASTDIAFPVTDGLRFLTGKNNVEETLGANGAGKSALWDALVWCCYGVTVKGRKASDIISWGAKKIYVEALWQCGETQISIKRESNPTRIYLDHKPVEQAEIDTALGMSRDCFLQSVVFGQGVATFYDLNSAGRGELLDEVLELSLWLKLSKAAGDKAKVFQRDVDTREKTLAGVQGKLDGMEPEASFIALRDQWDALQEAHMLKLVDNVERAEQALDAFHKENPSKNLDADLKKCNESIATLEHLIAAHVEKIRAFDKQIGGLEGEAVTLNKELAIYAREGACPICGNYLDPKSRKAKWQAARDNLTASNNAKQKLIDQQRMVLDVRQKNQNNLVVLHRTRDTASQFATQFKAKVESLEASIKHAIAEAEAFADNPAPNPHHAALEANRQARAALQVEIQNRLGAIEGVKEYTQQLLFWQDGFKRVRLWLTKQILGVLELETAAAAASLGLLDWRVSYSTEMELKGGTLKPGIHIQVSSPHAPGPWVDQSGGEEQRVRLAVAMGFAGVVQRMCGTLHALEVWDEPSNWLSEQGIEDLLQSLAYRAQNCHKTAWVVDHRTLGSGAFAESWSVVKDAAGSRITVLQTEG